MDFIDLEKYLDEFKNVSRLELEKIRYCSPNQLVFEAKARSLHENRDEFKEIGRSALQPGPLFHVLSVRIQPGKDDHKPFSIHGCIRVEYFDAIYGGMVSSYLYKCDPSVPDILNKGDALTLNCPDILCQPNHAFMPMFRSKIIVDLSGGHLVQGCFSLDDSESGGGYEQVKTVSLQCEQGSLIMQYVSIPFGIYCRIGITFFNKHGSKKHDFINVNGKVVARSVNNFGNSISEECILFSKQANETQRVELDRLGMKLSRCWVALPAYSSLIVGLDLSEFGTGRRIVNDTLELLPRQGLMSGDSFVLDDIIIQVCAAWFSPTPLCYQSEKVSGNALSSFSPPPQRTKQEDNEMALEAKCSTGTEEMTTEEVDDMDTEGEDETSSDDESLSRLNIPWGLRRHQSKPWPSPAVEIFSVFIGREKSKALRIHGSIDVLSDDVRICSIFERDENDSLWLSDKMKTTPILDGSRAYVYCNSLEMKIDLKSADNTLAIKGYVDWGDSALDSDSLCCDRQLCSFIQGENGFVAIHYSIFSRAVGAVIKVFLNLKTGLANLYPKVYGSLTCQYRHYDYSSPYNQNYYRSVLFMRDEEGSVQVNEDGSVPLSRSLVVVPSFSSLVLNVELSTGARGQKFSCAQEIRIGDGCKTLETSDCNLRIEVDWCEIK